MSVRAAGALDAHAALSGLLIGAGAGVALVLLWRWRSLDALRQPAARPVERAPSRSLPERVRHEVWRRDGGRCVQCGSRGRLEFDHIIPFSRGGSSTARNIELRCEPCNRRKGARI
jgi:hypothetical protein